MVKRVGPPVPKLNYGPPREYVCIYSNYQLETPVVKPTKITENVKCF